VIVRVPSFRMIPQFNRDDCSGRRCDKGVTYSTSLVQELTTMKHL
jgi:hypothetical protein